MNCTYVTDLAACRPSSAISQRWNKYCWRAVAYETVEGLKGRMLMATPRIAAPPVRYPLKITGWHRIYVGLGCSLSTPVVKVKLTSDPAYTVLCAPGRRWWLELREFFWKEADLTGQELHIAKPNGLHNGGPLPIYSYPAYLRLEPLTNREVARLRQERRNAQRGRLIGTEDGWSVIALDHPTTMEELYESILPYGDSDVRTVFYNAANGDCVNYPVTAVGTAPRVHAAALYPRDCDRSFVQSMKAFRAKRIDPLGAACDFAHRLGLEFYATVRTGCFICEPPYDDAFSSDFYRAHPEFRCRSREGREIPRLSYAWPEVQRHMLDLYLEIARRNIDGFGWIFVRGMPFVLYEAPLLDGFIRRYGKDPRQLPANDEAVMAFRAAIVTAFLRQAKKELNDLRARLGRPPLKLSAMVPATRDVNRRCGLDVATWAREGLIDILAVDWSLQDRNAPNNESPANMELDFFLEVVKGTKCRLAPRLDTRNLRCLAKGYAKGIETGVIWDTANLYRSQPQLWALVRRFGHKARVRAWAGKGAMPKDNFIALKSLGNCAMDIFPGNLAY